MRLGLNRERINTTADFAVADEHGVHAVGENEGSDLRSVVVFMCIELMLNAVNLTLITFSRINVTLDGQIMAFFVMVVAAAEVVVGLAIIMAIFKTRRSASVDDANLLKY